MRLLILCAFLLLGTTVHADSPARLWRATGMLQQAPTACVPFRDGVGLEASQCPESSGLVRVQAPAGEASFLVQISRHGGLGWFGLDGQALTHALEQVRQLKQPLHALKLANGEFAVLAVDRDTANPSGNYKSFLLLMTTDLQIKWVSPIGSVVQFGKRDELSGQVLESNNGDLIVVLRDQRPFLAQLRRDDGSLRRKRSWPATLTTLPTRGAEKTLPPSTSRTAPFRAWIYQGTLNLVTGYGWQRLSLPALDEVELQLWRDVLQTEQVPAAVQPSSAGDSVFVLFQELDAGNLATLCGLARIEHFAVVGWRSQVPNCNTLLQQLAVASDATLVFTAWESSSARRVAVIDATTGTLSQSFNLADFPYRLGATATHLGWLVYDPGSQKLRLRTAELSSGIGATSLPLSYPMDTSSGSPSPTGTSIPLIDSVANDSFLVYAGRHAPGLFGLPYLVTHVSASAAAIQSEVAAPTAPVPMANAIVAADATNTIRARSSSDSPAPWLIEAVATASGEMQWQRQFATVADQVVVGQDQIVFAHHLRPPGTEAWRIALTAMDRATGNEIYAVEQTLAANGPDYHFPLLALGAGSATLSLVYWVGNGTQVRTIDGTGQVIGEHFVPQIQFGDIVNGYGLGVITQPLQSYALDLAENSPKTLPNLAIQGRRYLAIADGTRDILHLGLRGSAPRLLQVNRLHIGADAGSLVWQRELSFGTASQITIRSQQLLASGHLLVQLWARDASTSYSEIVLVKLRLSDGSVEWQSARRMPAWSFDAGCRAIVDTPSPDILCIERSSTLISSFGRWLGAVRRVDAASGVERGVHWISIGSDALRGVLNEDGLTSLSFQAIPGAGFAYSDSMPGASPMQASETGVYRLPAVVGSGNVRIAGGFAPSGFTLRVINDGATPASQVRWRVDLTQLGHLDTAVCEGAASNVMQVKPYGASGIADIAAGGELTCNLAWENLGTPDTLTADAYAWPAYDYLDTHADDNFITRNFAQVFQNGFE